MRPQSFQISNDMVGIGFFLLSFLLIVNELIKVSSGSDVPFYSLNHALALACFILSAYFRFISRLRIKYPDLIYSAYALQFLFLLFVWLVRFNQ